MDLAVASPATVSRVGVIFVEPEVMGWAPLLATWLQTLTGALQAHVELIEGLFLWMLPPCLKFLRRELQEPVCSAKCCRRSCRRRRSRLLL